MNTEFTESSGGGAHAHRRRGHEPGERSGLLPNARELGGTSPDSDYLKGKSTEELASGLRTGGDEKMDHAIRQELTRRASVATEKIGPGWEKELRQAAYDDAHRPEDGLSPSNFIDVDPYREVASTIESWKQKHNLTTNETGAMMMIGRGWEWEWFWTG